jgi:cytochrome c oxidase subunit 2
MTMTLPTMLAQESLKKYFFSSIGASSQAADTESLFMYILWINIISFILLMVLLAYFIAKFHRSKQAANYQVSVAHNTPLELTWSIGPLLLMVPIFYWGFTGYADKLAAPQDAEEIRVNGKQWKWSFIYRNGATPKDPEVALLNAGQTVPVFPVPVNRPVKLIMSSTDVIHAFYIPDFRTKMDVIPNRYTSMWFFPQKLTNTRDKATGRLRFPDQPENPPHKVFCAEYCGQDHSEMGAFMEIVPREEYEATIRRWLDYDKGATVLDVGKQVFSAKGCASCHTVNGSVSTGPTWMNLFGAEHKYTNGEKQTVDENTLRDDILYSQKRILLMEGGAPYPTSMPIFAGQLSPLEIDGLIFYIKSLSSAHKAAAEAAGATTVQQYRDAQKKKPK